MGNDQIALNINYNNNTICFPFTEEREKRNNIENIKCSRVNQNTGGIQLEIQSAGAEPQRGERPSSKRSISQK